MFRCAVGPFNRVQDRLHPGGDAGRNIAGSKSGDNLVSDNLGRPRIGQHPFKPVADFQTNVSILDRHEKQDAVVGPLAAQLPRGGHSMGKVEQRLALQRWNDEDRHLIGRLGFVRRQIGGESLDYGRREDMRLIHDATTERRHIQRYGWKAGHPCEPQASMPCIPP